MGGVFGSIVRKEKFPEHEQHHEVDLQQGWYIYYLSVEGTLCNVFIFTPRTVHLPITQA